MLKTHPNNSQLIAKLNPGELELYNYLKTISYNYKVRNNNLQTILSLIHSVNSLEGLSEKLTSLYNNNLLGEFLQDIEKASHYVIINLMGAINFPLLNNSIDIGLQVKNAITNYAKGKTWENEFFSLQVQVINHLLQEGKYHIDIARSDTLKERRIKIEDFIKNSFIPLFKDYGQELKIDGNSYQIKKEKETLLGFILSHQLMYKHMPADFVSELIEKCDPKKVVFSFMSLPHLCQGVFYGSMEYKKEHLKLMTQSVNLEKKQLYNFYSMVLNRDKISNSSSYILSIIAKKHGYKNFSQMAIDTLAHKNIPYIHPIFLTQFLQEEISGPDSKRQKKLYLKIKEYMPKLGYFSNNESLVKSMNDFQTKEEKRELNKHLKKIKALQPLSILKI